MGPYGPIPVFIWLQLQKLLSVASKQIAVADKCLLLYVQSSTPDDGRKDRPKHVECHLILSN